MKTYFTTNLDWYSGVMWPILDNLIPPMGSDVFVHPASETFCHENKIPSSLKVVAIRINYDRVYCELWYDAAITKLSSQERLNHLYKQ